MRPRQLEVDVQVLADGEVVEATGRFFITTETLDPYHLLIDDHQGVVRCSSPAA